MSETVNITVTQDVESVQVGVTPIREFVTVKVYPNGQGLPIGGTTGQVLTKQSGTDLDAIWEDPAGSSGDWIQQAPPADGNIYAFRNGAPVKLKPETEWLIFATHVTDVSTWVVNGGTPILDSNGNVTFDTPETVISVQIYDGLTAASVVDASIFPALQYLELNSTPITTPPILTGLTFLNSLYLSATNITTPPVLTGLTALAELLLDATNITTPPVLTGLSSLQYLNLSYTDIATPPVLTGLHSLKTILLSHTPITTPPVFTGLHSLENILLSHTNITTPPVMTGMGSLYQLDLSHTDIATPPVLTGMSQLNILYLGGTPITTPPVLTGAPNLSELGLDGTNITTPPAVTGLYYLQYVYLNGTAITSVTAINNFFNQLDTAASVLPASDGYVDISGGTNAVPTAPSLAARSHLIDALYWTIVTN